MADEAASASPRPAGNGGEIVRGALLAVGIPRDVGANRPVELAGDRAWYVLEGTLDVFLQQRTEEGLGRRRLLATAGAGMLAWPGGAPTVPDRWRLVGVGHAGTRLLSAAGLELRTTVPLDVLADQAEAFVAAARDGRVPVQPPSEAGPVVPSAGARLAASGAAFAELVAATIDRALADEAAEADRISSELEREHKLLDSALTDLVELVDRHEALGKVTDDHSAQLDLALTRIGRQLGVEFPGTVDARADAGDPVGARVGAAGCRARVVTLRSGWWRAPGVALLGFSTDDDRPVALTPSRSGYQLFDPATGTTTSVDRALAGRVARTAYTIYRPLAPSVASAGSLLRSVLPSVRRELWLLAGLGALAGLITLVTPMVTSIIYNSVLPQGDRSLLLAVSGLLIGGAITWGFVALSQNLAVVRIQGQLEANLDPGLMDRLLQLPATFFRRYDTGDLGTRAFGLQIIRQELSGAVVTTFLTLVFSVFNVVLLFVYSAVLGAVALGILILVVTILVLLNRAVLHYLHRVFAYTGDISAHLFQLLQGVQKMRSANAEARLMARWASLFRLQQREIYAAGRINAYIFATIAALPAVLALGLYGVAGAALIGTVSAGDFIAVVTAMGQFTAALAGVALTIGPLMTIVPLWQRLLPILEEPIEEVGTTSPGSLSGRIGVRDVSFSYDPDGPPALQNVSMEIQPGEFVALTGPSGSGKSTLLRLLLGLDQPTSGTVLFDGKDLRSLDARAVRHQLGVVMQGARPLPGEIMATILGDTGGSEADAWTAAEQAELAEDIRRMPMRMHTIVGEGGLAFSGGQLQRMMIARALARRPRVLIFDEATSALDDRIQTLVSQHIAALNTTRVVVAHRLSTIRNANTVHVLDGGRLVQSGSFDELMAAEGPFRRLASRQLV
jgi:NHLM bacteriocin system ABC transporter ATP-binding protein